MYENCTFRFGVFGVETFAISRLFVWTFSDFVGRMNWTILRDLTATSFVVVYLTGLMTQITDNQKYGMIEAISHLIHRDYEAIVEDFVLLDFIPEGVNLAPIMPVLGKVFDQALEGGGAKNINFQDLAADLAQITFDYPFRIPPYFALIIRAIGVLEGIALVGDSDFAIVDEAYPYIAQVSHLPIFG